MNTAHALHLGEVAARHAISRALRHHAVPIERAGEAGVEFPVEGCRAEIHFDEEAGTAAAAEVCSLGHDSATLRWRDREPLIRTFALRLVDVPAMGWIPARIEWIRAISDREWLVGCVFHWSDPHHPARAG